MQVKIESCRPYDLLDSAMVSLEEMENGKCPTPPKFNMEPEK